MGVILLSELSMNRAPIYEALLQYRKNRIVPFDVPGHKQGRGNRELMDFLGEKCLSVDVNSMKPLDNLSHPTSVIKQAEELAAKAFGCDNVFFMVNGTTSAVQAMIMSVCKEGEKIILPRNVHRSAINSLIISGAIPIYVNPGINNRLGISLGVSVESVQKAIEENPDAKAILVNNPTYYGVCSDLKRIIDLAHANNMAALVDEAHGTHFYFGKNLPPAAMHLGADMSSVSVHKTGGSLTQSSLLLVNAKKVNPGYVRTIISLTQTTSASYLLLSSLDIARKNLALKGEDIFNQVAELAVYARNEINDIGGYYAFSSEIIDNYAVHDFDITKLSIHTLDIGLAGIEVYDILRDEYNIQTEFGDIGNMLAIISVGDNRYSIERLVAALTEVKRLYGRDKKGMLDHEYINPVLAVSPKTAFYSEKKPIEIRNAKGAISGEFVMAYPPGIPVLAPGEVVTEEALEYIYYAKEKGALLTGTEDMSLGYINVLKSERMNK